MSSQRHNSGFTLIEGIIAVGIISGALIVGLTLAVSNLQAARANSNRIIAANLAREGVEIMRNIRDSNWLRRKLNVDKDTFSMGTLDFYNWHDYFDGWPDASGCSAPCVGAYFDITMVDYTNVQNNDHIFKLVEAPDGLSQKDTITCLDDSQVTCRVQKKNGVYFQSVNVPAVTGGAYSPFYRRIHVRPICYAGSAEDPYVDTDPNAEIFCETNPGHTLVGHLIVSQVLWREGSRISQVEIKERLYNWRSQ